MITTIYVSCSVFADLLGKGLVCLGFWLSLSLSRRRNIREGSPRAYACFMFCGERYRTMDNGLGACACNSYLDTTVATLLLYPILH